MDVAESRCAEIKREIESYYLKTCQIYDDEHHPSTPGVACQTDFMESTLSLTENEKMPDIKLKIALPRRKRGRPMKAQSQPRKRNTMDDQVRGQKIYYKICYARIFVESMVHSNF